MKTIDLIAGARPNFIKIAPIIDALQAQLASGGSLKYRLIHTGQHYDHSMSGSFFSQLGIPEPDVHLGAGSGTQAEQTGAIMCGYEQALSAKKSDLCLVVGDVTSTMACTIVARKAGIPVAHVEAGIRSGDWSMPEEINRVVTDALTNWFFTTSETAGKNLVSCGVPESSIYFVGNVMIDTLLKQRPNFRPATIWNEAKLSEQNYFVLTLHRPGNVDDLQKLDSFLREIDNNVKNIPVIFPAHPRTQEIFKDSVNEFTNIRLIDPLGYFEFNHLVEHAKGVITDSGGITEETTVMGVPCMTLRDHTERPETVEIGTNELIGTDPSSIRPAIQKILDGIWKQGSIPKKWDGHSAKRIVEHLQTLLT